MKDNQGLYYYPYPQSKGVRMYVRRFGDNIEFRMWKRDDPNLWEEHGWISHEAIVQAAKRFEKKAFNPNQAYDVEVAKALLDENR
jgi:hypothetical protein